MSLIGSHRIYSVLIAWMVIGGAFSATPAAGQSELPEDFYDAFLLEDAPPPVESPARVTVPPTSVQRAPLEGPAPGPARPIRSEQPLQPVGHQQVPPVKQAPPNASAAGVVRISSPGGFEPVETTAGESPCLGEECLPGFDPQQLPEYFAPVPAPGVPYDPESPAQPESVAPGTTAPDRFAQPAPAQPSPVQPAPAQPAAPAGTAGFGGGLAGGALLASASAPAMIGDGFGPGARSFAIIRPRVAQAFATVATQTGSEFDGFLAADLDQGVAGGTYFARRADGNFVPLNYGIDTNGDGGGDLFTGLSAFAATSQTLPADPPINVDPDTVVNAGPFEAEATGTSAFGSDVFNVYQPLEIQIPSPSAAGGVVGRQKIAENTSPIPQNRIFLGYSFFDNVPLAPGGVNVHRLSPGIEKTFLYDRFSIEARMPFASTLDSDILAGGLTPTGRIELGNLTGNIKGIISQTETTTFSAGLQAFFPTADDVRVIAPGGQTLVEARNRAVHLLPFLGMLLEPTPRFFVQGFVQFDVDAGGNPVRIDPDGNGLQKVGRAEDPTFFYADLAIGYWLHRSLDGAITGIIPTAEIHYTRALEDFESVRSEGFVIGTGNGRFTNTNLMLGGTVQFGSGSAVSVGYGFPVGDKTDKMFDGELRVLMNHYFW